MYDVPGNIRIQIQKLANKFGYEIWSVARNYSEKDIKIMDFAHPYTLLNKPDMKCLIDVVTYIIQNNVQGSFVECGVWKGGAVIAMLKTLQQLNCSDKEICLFDTFSGMTEPTEHDFSISGFSAKKIKSEVFSKWGISLQDVKNNVYKTDYDKSKLKFIEGDVMKTIQNNIPDKIALLRLDTDWYESTKYELEYLFPKLSEGGVLIVDDYGRWQGAKKATDDYIKNNKIKIFLNQVFPSGAVIGIK